MNVVAMVLRAVQIARGKGVRVTFEAGWETRGNGYTGRYVGFLVHHTATPSSLANPFPSRRLLRDGRSDLPGPLCNSAGPADGSIHIMAAHAANHAGASGGRSMGPLPVTRLFNPTAWGHEIDYAGTVPMLTAQYRAAALWSMALLQALREHGQIPTADKERIRAHAETSITGKWDAGDAPGRTINMPAFRTAAAIYVGTPSTQEDKVYRLFQINGQGAVYVTDFVHYRKVANTVELVALADKIDRPAAPEDWPPHLLVMAGVRADDPEPFLVQEQGQPEVYVADGNYVQYRHVRDQEELAHLKARLGEVEVWAPGTLGVLGVLVSDATAA